MKGHFNHYGCPFYSKQIQDCAFSEDKVTVRTEYEAQCADRTLPELIEEERYNPYKRETLDALRRLPPSYITWLRIQAIEHVLNERKNG